MVTFGVHRPRLLGSVRARTTGRVGRRVRRAVVPGYGGPGTGRVRDRGRAAYGPVRGRSSIGVSEILRRLLK